MYMCYIKDSFTLVDKLQNTYSITKIDPGENRGRKSGRREEMRIGSCFVGWRRKRRQLRKFRRMVGFRVVHGRVTRSKGSRRQIRGVIWRRSLRREI